MPIMPLPSPAANKSTPAANGTPPVPSVAKPAANAAFQQQTANTQAATAAVAAAMAKLGAAPAQPAPKAKPQLAGGGGDVIDNLSKKVNEMRVDANKNPNGATTNFSNGLRGRGRGRGGGRGGARGIEVPNSDFDFASANAQFKKEELSKATTTGTEGLNGDAAADDVVIPPAEKTYDAKSSFFDNISSDAKQREAEAEAKRGGREFRAEDRKRNMETFGIGSVDGGYRGGFRGRGGRGRGFRAGGVFRGRGRGSGTPAAG